jgi:hypothetical protein
MDHLFFSVPNQYPRASPARPASGDTYCAKSPGGIRMIMAVRTTVTTATVRPMVSHARSV